MSLLIDALKQAEAARAQAQGTEPTTPGAGIELEPLSEQPAAPSPPPVSNPRDTAPPTPPRDQRRARPAVTPSGVTAPHAVRELFEVKQPSPNHLPLILVATGITLFLLGAGYVWWQIQPRNSLMIPATNMDATSVQMPVASATPTAPVTAANTSINTASTEPSPGPVIAQTAPAISPPLATPPARRNARGMKQASSREATETLVFDNAKPQIRSAPNATGDLSGIQAAYGAFLDGNYALAQQRYQEVLRQDPRSVDAMNALGLIAWRSGQPDVAERMFRAAVQADPKDATATSQLALLYSEGDPASAESRLRNLIASQPNAGAAYYALGSLMARQARWNEAQQSLFQAYTLDSDNPDVLFNLAVSLEHLAQPAVARQFYERALQASTHRPAGFNKSVAQSRVLTLGNR